MCTAISFKTKDHYFGRTLDLEYDYNESVTVTPRNFPFKFTNRKENKNHSAIIGIATVIDTYPLYYEATNEAGLSVAGLNFPNNAFYHPTDESKVNIAPFEFIPYILTECKTVEDAKKLLEKANIANIDFRPDLKASPLHWMISDKNKSITVESTVAGLQVYENPIGVLTNNPPFDLQIKNLEKYKNLSSKEPEHKPDMSHYSKGLGAIGLPGDLSSASRFVRAAFTKENSVCGDSESESVSQFFHILGSVSHTRGTVDLGGKYEITVYTSCCNTDRGILYYTTYENPQISAIDMNKLNLSSDELFEFPLETEMNINRII
ncbi:MAG: choloylglycine hydrolase [Clostridia bacterium]|nr:choloylglycine hydrolase [Clostridia bacterium]